MAWLEITLNTPQGSVDSLATALTGLGFADLCIEDQQEFETFLEENREYWTISTRTWKRSSRASAG